MTRKDAMERARAWYDDDTEGYFPTLARHVAIPTESQEPSRLPELYRYHAEETRPAFEAMGFEVEVYDNPVEGQGPVMLASRIEDPSLPTVLGYGHGDVVRGQEDRWTKGEGPWVLARDGDKVYGRGTADNKGQLVTHMGAYKAVLETRGSLGFNAKFMIETGEENGSQGLKQLVAENREAFAADALFASDGPRADRNRANLTLGSRGALNFELSVNLREGAHHSGNWGGLLANPGIILAHALATITDARGRILVEGWRPETVPGNLRDILRGATAEKGPGAPEIDPDWGEPGLTAAEKLATWNSFEVLAFVTGIPDAPLNAVPPTARAVCQLRYIPETKGSDIVPALREHLDRHGFSMVEILPPPSGNAGGFEAARTDPDHPWAKWVEAAVGRAGGTPPVVTPSTGGSICNDVFAEVLQIPFVWLPLSYAGCSQHAPDEHILVPLIQEGLGLVTGVYWDLGAPETRYRP
ncbi:M20 family metallopeptidase [Kaustia mangrovi]|uniref:M20 family metallopeptidase n=1 Tax=Kaustia mangrovi TaxID=2593653 RepID=A0A7S8C6P3_9HYPH|nr:M20 family metallopeptidase [Kaustia mangrovi]QPC44364.1 M20 family metallopeptidase [Kaustia mangrovi]